MKKPSAVLHMTGYGSVYGFLLAMLSFWGFMLLISGGTLENDIGLNIGFAVVFSFLFGALPGAAIGFIEGWILKYLTRNVQIPFNQDDWKSTSKLSLGIIGGLTFVAMFGFLFLISQATIAMLGIVFWLAFFLAPATIAGGAAAYATNHYMQKLLAWGNIGKLKNEYKPKNQLAYTDSADEDTPIATETDSQIESQR